jgi:hypothetical protein
VGLKVNKLDLIVVGIVDKADWKCPKEIQNKFPGG